MEPQPQALNTDDSRKISNRELLPHSHKTVLAISLVIVCGLIIFAHWPALSAKALSFDDGQYLVENKLVQTPGWSSTWRFLSEVFEPSTVGGYYQPLTMISLMLDCTLGGRPDNLMPFHRTSLIIHILNTALIAILLFMLFENLPAAIIPALLFGLHPMTVETIAWVGERKTVLAAFFALTSLISYAAFTRKNSKIPYAACLITYVLALMSKPISLPLPALMLLIDFWPLNRLNWRTILEKLPLFAVASLFLVVAYISQSRTSGAQWPTQYGFRQVPLILSHDIIFYPAKMLWPVNLSSHYPFPKPLNLSQPMVCAGVIGTVVLVPLLILSLLRTRALLTGWLFFFIAVLPTMQVIRFSNVIASDKFAYLPSLGFLMLIAALITRLAKTPAIRNCITKSLILALIPLTLASAETLAARKYLTQWKDSISLYNHMLKLAPNAGTLHNMLGHALVLENRQDEAMESFRKAVRADPNDYLAIFNFGVSLKLQGRIDDAITQYLHALQVNPNIDFIHNNLAGALMEKGNLDQAIRHYYCAIGINPRLAVAHYSLARALQSDGQSGLALLHYRLAIRLKPDFPDAYNNLGLLLAERGQFEQAVAQYRHAIQLKPHFPQAYNNLANAFKTQGKMDQAIQTYHQALILQPSPGVHYNLALALIITGQFTQAHQNLESAVKL